MTVSSVPGCRDAIIASDLHCKRDKPCRALQYILEAYKTFGADCLIIAGDLFEDLYFPLSPREVIHYIKKIVGNKALPKKLIYVTSGASHDPIIDKVTIIDEDGGMIVIAPKKLVISIGGRKVCIVHGDIFLKNGVLAHLYNRIYSFLGTKLAIEKRLKKIFGSECEWLIAGHTHIPGIDHARKAANPGTWKSIWFFHLPYWRRPTNTFIYFGRKKITLIKINGGNIAEQTTL